MSIFSGVLSLTWQATYKLSKNIFYLIFGLILGNLILCVANYFYWEYLKQIIFSVSQMSSIEYSYLVNFGSLENTKTFFGVFICIIFSSGICVTHLEYFFVNKSMKIAWHQLFSMGESFSMFLCFLTPMMIIISDDKDLNYGQISIVHILLIITGLYVLIFGSLGVTNFYKLSRYYKDTMSNPEREHNLVIVHESQYVKKPFIFYELFKNKEYMRKLDAEKVRLLPCELHAIENSSIKLDIYDDLMFLRKPSQRHKISVEMTQVEGIFNLAYCLDEDIANEISPQYDGAFSDLDKTVSEVIRVNRYTDYRKKQAHTLARLKIDQLVKTNCIVDEIVFFRQYFENHLNEFVVFDYAIKWLEIVNYIYTLIAISKNEVVVTDPKISGRINYADFQKWRELRTRVVTDEDGLSVVIKRSSNDLNAFQEFNWVWKEVITQTYFFQKYSIEELLEGANKLRDCTRGHGVFTFDISQTINLKLLSVLTFLINELIDNHMLDNDFANLESLGWLVYSGDTPYFLYSLNKSDEIEEFIFNSFQGGSSLALPIDIQG